MPKRKNKPGAGRPPEGRTKMTITMLPEAWAILDASKGDAARGEFLETLLQKNFHRKRR